MAYRILIAGAMFAIAACSPSTETIAPVIESTAVPTATPAPTATPTPVPPPDPSPAVAPTPTSVPAAEQTAPVRTGAGVLVDNGFAQLHGQRVGLIAHRASVVDGVHLAEQLHEHPDIDLTAIFAPEHGLFGLAGAGEAVTDTLDPATGVRVFSLYGANRAPSANALADIDVLVYDLQDVGARFFTYTSTLGLAMEAAADAGITFVVLDRPNPLGGGLQGPTLARGLESFIGMYPLPSAYGLTSGELARLIQNQALVDGVADLNLTVVPMQNWTRDMTWDQTGLEWISPSPNLPTFDAAVVYPGTVLFEATTISEGRGTDEPFQLIGAPWIDGDALVARIEDRRLPGVRFEAATFTPRSIPGAAASPRFEGQELGGVRVIVDDPGAVDGVAVGLHLLDAIMLEAQADGRDPATIIDRPDVFDRLAGSSLVRSALIEGVSVLDLIDAFDVDHASFAELAKSSLLYGSTSGR